MAKPKEVSPAPGFAGTPAVPPAWPAPKQAPSWPAPQGPGGAVAANATPPWATGQGSGAAISPIKGPISADDYAMNLYLKGSDIPAELSQVEVQIVEFVKVQGSRSPVVARIAPNPSGKELLPLNKTNINQLAQYVGKDLSAAVGKFVLLVVYPVPNPQTGGTARGLYVAGARDAE